MQPHIHHSCTDLQDPSPHIRLYPSIWWSHLQFRWRDPQSRDHLLLLEEHPALNTPQCQSVQNSNRYTMESLQLESTSGDSSASASSISSEFSSPFWVIDLCVDYHKRVYKCSYRHRFVQPFWSRPHSPPQLWYFMCLCLLNDVLMLKTWGRLVWVTKAASPRSYKKFCIRHGVKKVGFVQTNQGETAHSNY